MKDKFIGIVIGITIIVFGIMVYPYFKEYLADPLFSWLEDSLLPIFMDTVPAWIHLIFAIAPFALFALIIFVGVMYIRRKIAGSSEERQP